MTAYGFLRGYPIICHRDDSKKLVVKDGQHRLAVAEELGLTVHYIVEDVDFDIALVNSCAKTWSLPDYAFKHAKNGKRHYEDGIAFCELHGLPIGVGFALLSGTTSFGNLAEDFRDGNFRIKDTEWAEAVAGIYTGMIAISKDLRGSRFLAACMAICRIDKFDANRLFKCAKRCRDKLVSYSTRDAYLDMLEEVYNFGHQKLVPLKMPAIQAMRDRNATGEKALSKKRKTTKK
jgi:hypothetical protein